jgi:5-(carboxyamino)imidazole ribonucleotide synthase
VILPGQTLGLLGGGQLGRMFTQAAQRMGFEVMVLDPDPDSPAGRIVPRHLQATYLDQSALETLGKASAGVTTEFENVPASALGFLERFCPVRPGPRAVELTQDRMVEKTFARGRGLGTADFHAVLGDGDVEAAFRAIGAPALIKTARLGYDGKGQAEVGSAADIRAAFERFGRAPCILEQRVDLALELSVVLARGSDGTVVTYPVAENRHVGGILDSSVVPARVDGALAAQAREAATALAAAMDYVGTMAVEFFVTRTGALLVNEIAPRPHNSGHYTLDACPTDQFEQQVRALTGLPLGNTGLLSPVAMVNLLGDLWAGGVPRWERALADRRVHLHLYGKTEARPGRKMGHLNILADSPGEALEAVLAARARLLEH